MSTYDTSKAQAEFDNYVATQLSEEQRNGAVNLSNLEAVMRRQYAWSQIEETDFSLSSLSPQNLYDISKDFDINWGFDSKDTNNPVGLNENNYEEYSQKLEDLILQQAIPLKSSQNPQDQELLNNFISILQERQDDMSVQNLRFFEALIQKPKKKIVKINAINPKPIQEQELVVEPETVVEPEVIQEPVQEPVPEIKQPTAEFAAFCPDWEANLTKRNIAFERVSQPAVEGEIEYQLYPQNKTPDESQPNGHLTMHQPDNFTLKSTDYNHFAALTQTLYKQGATNIAVGQLSDDKEENRKFLATLVLAGASYGMAVEGVNLEEIKDIDPKIQLLIEKRKMRAEINDLHRKLETAEGDQAEQLRSELKGKIATAIQHHVEKGSIDCDKTEDVQQRIERLKNVAARPDDTSLREKVDNNGHKHVEDDGHQAVRLAKRELNRQVMNQVISKVTTK